MKFKHLRFGHHYSRGRFHIEYKFTTALWGGTTPTATHIDLLKLKRTTTEHGNMYSLIFFPLVLMIGISIKHD